MKYPVEDYLNNPGRCNCCGVCKHWHEWEKDAGQLAKGDCDKIPKGHEWTDEEFGKTYQYDGYSFEDECYDDVFNCFEPIPIMVYPQVDGITPTVIATYKN